MLERLKNKRMGKRTRRKTRQLILLKNTNNHGFGLTEHDRTDGVQAAQGPVRAATVHCTFGTRQRGRELNWHLLTGSSWQQCGAGTVTTATLEMRKWRLESYTPHSGHAASEQQNWDENHVHSSPVCWDKPSLLFPRSSSAWPWKESGFSRTCSLRAGQQLCWSQAPPHCPDPPYPQEPSCFKRASGS